MQQVRAGRGAVLELEDGRQILDCISSWWVTLHGHGQPEIAAAVAEQAKELEQVIAGRIYPSSRRKGWPGGW